MDDGNAAVRHALLRQPQSPTCSTPASNALEHFNAFGWHEGRDPNAFFDTSGYLAVNKDVAAGGVNPLEHYHQCGWQQGRDPSADFDTTLYLVRNPGRGGGRHRSARALPAVRPGRRVAQAYAAIGSIVDGFDAQYYLFAQSRRGGGRRRSARALQRLGWHEGRNPNAWFDTAGYLAHYADVAAAGINPLDHYEQFGWQEGRDPSAVFDTLGYLAANPDVAAADVNPLDHYLQFGIYEGRQVVNDAMWG